MYDMQKQLDSYIEKKHNLGNEDLLDRKLMAFYVELAELANETRCFKFWSEKGPSPNEIILEEYVDGIHFILSVGLECDFDKVNTVYDMNSEGEKTGEDLVPCFYEVLNGVHKFREDKSSNSYTTLFHAYLQLGAALNFSEQQIVKAYEKKNNVNFDRQDNGY
nr:dUTP diphosphatase [Bacillus alkalicola]